MCFAGCHFNERKIDIILVYFLQPIFDRQKIDVVLMYFFDAFSMVGKLTQFQRAHFNAFIKNKKNVVLTSLWDKIMIYQKSKLL